MWASFMYTILNELNKQLHLEAELSKESAPTESRGSVPETPAVPETPESKKEAPRTRSSLRDTIENVYAGWDTLHEYLFPPVNSNRDGMTTLKKSSGIFRMVFGCLVFLVASLFLAFSCAVLISLATLHENVPAVIDGLFTGLDGIIRTMKPGEHVGPNGVEAKINRKESDEQNGTDDRTDEEKEGIMKPGELVGRNDVKGGTNEKGSEEQNRRDNRTDEEKEDIGNPSSPEKTSSPRQSKPSSPSTNYEVLKNGISLIKIRDSDKTTRVEYLKTKRQKFFKESFKFNVEKCSEILDMEIPNVTDELARAGNANYNTDIRHFQGLSNVKRWRDEKPGEFSFDEALKAIKQAHKSTDDEPDPGGIEAFGKLTFIHKLKLVFSPQFFSQLKGISIPLLVAAAMVVLWILVEDWGEKIEALLASVAAPFAALVPVVKRQLSEISDTLKSKNDKFVENFAESKSREYADKVFDSDAHAKDPENPTPAMEEEIKELKEKVWVRRGKGSREIVKDRVDESSYETDLGIVHQAQQDLMRLSHSMLDERDAEPSSDKENMFPRGKPRIVLFIDDIDRCPPNQVVDVLEALQLLVKTKLFVVLVALDTQYVTLALEEKYQILNATNGWHPSGTDYIEKILQISYRLAPIERPKAVKGYVTSQMEVNEEEAVSSNSKYRSRGVRKTEPVTDPLTGAGTQKLPAESVSAPEESTPEQVKLDETDPNGNNDTQNSDDKETAEKVDKERSNRTAQIMRKVKQERDEGEDERLTVMLKAVHFEKYEKDIVMKAAECTTLFPRSLKRVMNIVKITKFLMHRQSRNRAKLKATEKRGEDPDEDEEFSERERQILREASICLLVVCAASNLPIRKRIACFYSRYELMVVGKDKIGNARNLKEFIIQNGFGELNCEYTRPMQGIFLKFAQVWWYDKGKDKDKKLKFNMKKWQDVKEILRLVRAFSIIPEMNVDDYELSIERSRANVREERESLIADIKSLRELLSLKSDESEMDQELRDTLLREVTAKEKKVLQLSRKMHATGESNSVLDGLWYSDDFYGSHGREWVQVSAIAGGTVNTRVIEAVKVTGDPIPAGHVTWKTTSWPTEGEKTEAQVQVRSDPNDPGDFSWRSAKLTLASQTEIKLEMGWSEGTFKKETNENLEDPKKSDGGADESDDDESGDDELDDESSDDDDSADY
mmetsp:Transcript_18939/g.46916  ORF Transcript_18939/g.46916 Transcript_18939/m.46916 type:complete len:1179 (+) Transcript_18939:251-3787(+)